MKRINMNVGSGRPWNASGGWGWVEGREERGGRQERGDGATVELISFVPSPPPPLTAFTHCRPSFHPRLRNVASAHHLR